MQEKRKWQIIYFCLTYFFKAFVQSLKKKKTQQNLSLQCWRRFDFLFFLPNHQSCMSANFSCSSKLCVQRLGLNLSCLFFFIILCANISRKKNKQKKPQWNKFQCTGYLHWYHSSSLAFLWLLECRLLLLDMVRWLEQCVPSICWALHHQQPAEESMRGVKWTTVFSLMLILLWDIGICRMCICIIIGLHHIKVLRGSFVKLQNILVILSAFWTWKHWESCQIYKYFVKRKRKNRKQGKCNKRNAINNFLWRIDFQPR